MDALEARILPALRRDCGIVPGSKGFVAVSGGRDSLATLHLLAALAPRLRIGLEAVHFDHGLRPESGSEAEWVREAVRRLGLPFHLRRAGHLSGLGTGVQASARAWRREQALRLAAQTGAAWIATGHQLDDHLETLLLKLLRGAHLSGLKGMAPRQGPWVRPVLTVWRRDLQAYLERRGVAWLDDPSNESPRYKRNRVRRELLPLLDDLAGGAIGARLLTLERQSAALGAWLDAELARHAPEQSPPEAALHWLDIAGLRRLPSLVQGAALYRFIQARLPGPVEYERIAQTLDLLARVRPGRAGVFTVELPGGRVLRRASGRLLLEARRGPGEAESRST
jgi:tRNA(Ile)-lysidine synthetase-like protein